MSHEVDPSTPRSLIPLAGDTIDVWYVDPNTVAQAILDHWYAELLPANERKQCDRFLFEKDQRLCLVARALLRSTLSRYRDIPVTGWRFGVGSHGKPYVLLPDNSQELQFNLSHTNGMVVCAVRRHQPVGIDVENTARRAPLDIAHNYFAPRECQDLSSLDETDQPAAFFTYWTLKESYIKARGLGLAIPLDAFAFRLDACSTPRIEFSEELEDDPARWRFFLPDEIAAGYRIAVATMTDQQTPTKLRIEKADLQA